MNKFLKSLVPGSEHDSDWFKEVVNKLENNSDSYLLTACKKDNSTFFEASAGQIPLLLYMTTHALEEAINRAGMPKENAIKVIQKAAEMIDEETEEEI